MASSCGSARPASTASESSSTVPISETSRPTTSWQANKQETIMLAKALEIRDEGTFIAVLAVDMNPDKTLGSVEGIERFARQRYLLRRCGYACDGRPNVIVTRLDGNGQATNDPFAWGAYVRTFRVAHDYIIDHWNELKDGDVVDVEFILAESAAPKRSERETVPL